MDKKDINRQVEEYDASRPGPKTLMAVIVVGLFIAAFYNWPDVKAVIDFI
jgi:hypothetical protein